MSKKQNKQPPWRKLEQEALDRLSALLMQGVHPEALDAEVTAAAKRIVRQMTPAQIAQMRHPEGKLVPLSRVPQGVIKDHLLRYTMNQLQRGQFIVLMLGKAHYIFCMDHEAREERDKKRTR